MIRVTLALLALLLTGCVKATIPQKGGAAAISLYAVGYNLKTNTDPPIELTVNDGATSAVLELGKEGIRVGGASFATHAADRLADSAKENK